MIVVANSSSINFKKTGTIRTRGVLSKKSEKKSLTYFWYSPTKLEISVPSKVCDIIIPSFLVFGDAICYIYAIIPVA
jgi:hypothetical protein